MLIRPRIRVKHTSTIKDPRGLNGYWIHYDGLVFIAVNQEGLELLKKKYNG